MGDPGREEEGSNSDANMDDAYRKGVPRLTLSHNSNVTNEPNRSPAWQVVQSKKRETRSSSNDSDGESSQAIQNNNRYFVLSDRQDLPNIDQTRTEQVDQTTSDINSELEPPLIFIPDV